MLKSIAITLAAFALAGCATADHNCREGPLRRSFARDSRGSNLNHSARTNRTLAITKPMASTVPDDEVVLAAVPKYSKEWVALYETMRARDDAKLARALIICRGCDGDGTGPTK
jgi:hypothetical protein